ncbi:MAG TPA: helicase [Prolixibacteraceae bacterium]|jgi:superfamily II DNA/RNA helicase|nr:helicase [Prolixibacteraceae bacterium]
MSSPIKNQIHILEKLGIEKLNAMQVEAQETILSSPEIVLLSPTGTGKTLAFLLPIIAELDINCAEVQVLIVVPSRELAIQIEQVIREMGTGYKANAVYGGRAGSKDKTEIRHRPAILIGTPGRIADHMRRENFSTQLISTLVLDEFDKSLEIGFENEMREILGLLPNIRKKILTSATQEVEIPRFVNLKNPVCLNYLDKVPSQLKIKTILSPSQDKLETLALLLHQLGDQPGIVFCNFKDTIQEVSDFLTYRNINHGCFYGGMEQKDRERALIKFRNGTHQLIVATDLAARGIDIPEIKFIIHYQLPQRSHEFTHRNGRTARMFNDGTAYVLKGKNEDLPDFIENAEVEELKEAPMQSSLAWKTLFVSGGRKDKISKGDIAGLFMKQGLLNSDQLGTIEIKQDCAFVAVLASEVNKLIQLVDNSKLKNKKVRVTVI